MTVNTQKTRLGLYTISWVMEEVKYLMVGKKLHNIKNKKK